MPLRGELIPGPEGFEIEVLDSDPRRVKKVRIHRSKNRTIERDREGRRRFSGSGDIASAVIVPAPPSEAPLPDAPRDDTATATQPTADTSAPQKS